jgi:hypothetical protein
MRIAGACMLLLALSATAAEPASPEKTGLAIGEQAPGEMPDSQKFDQSPLSVF